MLVSHAYLQLEGVSAFCHGMVACHHMNEKIIGMNESKSGAFIITKNNKCAGEAAIPQC
jgi:hypothetical protein